MNQAYEQLLSGKVSVGVAKTRIAGKLTNKKGPECQWL